MVLDISDVSLFSPIDGFRDIGVQGSQPSGGVLLSIGVSIESSVSVQLSVLIERQVGDVVDSQLEGCVSSVEGFVVPSNVLLGREESQHSFIFDAFFFVLLVVKTLEVLPILISLTDQLLQAVLCPNVLSVSVSMSIDDFLLQIRI